MHTPSTRTRTRACPSPEAQHILMSSREKRIPQKTPGRCDALEDQIQGISSPKHAEGNAISRKRTALDIKFSTRPCCSRFSVSPACGFTSERPPTRKQKCCIICCRKKQGGLPLLANSVESVAAATLSLFLFGPAETAGIAEGLGAAGPFPPFR